MHAHCSVYLYLYMHNCFSRLALMVVMTMRATAEISTSTELAQASKMAQSENILRSSKFELQRLRREDLQSLSFLSLYVTTAKCTRLHRSNWIACIYIP